jgi:glycosyltransferase involved in cell wall biosynthesis
MATAAPLISILLLTFNRSHLLPRAIASVLMQDFHDYELVIIDDCSTDDTPSIVSSFKDSRIRSIRHDMNLGAQYGDREIFRRFVYKIAKSRYIGYLCDDDYWIASDLLSREVELFREHDDLSMVNCSQLSHMLTTPESYLGGSPEKPLTLNREILAPFFDFNTSQSKSPHLTFRKGIHPKTVMSSEEFLESFSSDPINANNSLCGTLWSRDRFIRSGTLRSSIGAKWQGGYEFFMGPALIGGVAYLDEPLGVTEVRQTNASFNRTQLEHYLDSIASIETAFRIALTDPEFKSARRRYWRPYRNTIRHVSRAFLGNAITIARTGSLTMCSEENISRPVTFWDVLPIYVRNRMWIDKRDYELMFKLPFEARWHGAG